MGMIFDFYYGYGPRSVWSIPTYEVYRVYDKKIIQLCGIAQDVYSSSILP